MRLCCPRVTILHAWDLFLNFPPPPNYAGYGDVDDGKYDDDAIGIFLIHLLSVLEFWGENTLIRAKEIYICAYTCTKFKLKESREATTQLQTNLVPTLVGLFHWHQMQNKGGICCFGFNIIYWSSSIGMPCFLGQKLLSLSATIIMYLFTSYVVENVKLSYMHMFLF